VGDAYHISWCFTICCADLVGAVGVPSGRVYHISLSFAICCADLAGGGGGSQWATFIIFRCV
jgi:hypothetical protein